MAEILTTKGLAAELENIIRKAEKELYLISFSFIISEHFIKRLRQAADRNVTIRIIYGVSISDTSMKGLMEIPNLQIRSLKNLHAKIYVNESSCLIGSMNFSEPSEKNNTELGVLLTLKEDKTAFLESVALCKEILTESKLERPMLPKSIDDFHKINNPFEPKLNGSNNQIKLPKDELKYGFCIRNGTKIPFNIDKPFSPSAYKSWENFGDPTYPENYCHFSGEPSGKETSYEKPILKKNWKTAREIFDL